MSEQKLTFDRLQALSDPDIQKVLLKVLNDLGVETLVTALKLCPAELIDHHV